MTVTIEIDDSLYGALGKHISEMRKPPRLLEDGSIVVEPMFPSPEAYIEQVLAQNFARLLEANPPPEMLEARRKIEEAQQQILAAATPTVKIRR